MEVNDAYQKILEIIKFNITDQQREEIKQILEKLSRDSFNQGNWNIPQEGELF